MKIHELKTDPEVFNAVYTGKKTYEIRLNDRGFKDGDILRLRETKHSWQSMKDQAFLSIGEKKPLIYTGREVTVVVTHMLCGPIYGLKEGWVLMSIKFA